MKSLILVTGCSGDGKSTVIDELARRGLFVMPEPGRRIVADQLARGGDALPWTNRTAFARRALAVAIADHEEAASAPGPVFFDRGIVDAALALEQATGESVSSVLAAYRYHPIVFLAPPWEAIFAVDDGRRHGFAEAVDEYRRIAAALPTLGYEPMALPLGDPAERADFMLAALAA